MKPMWDKEHGCLFACNDCDEHKNDCGLCKAAYGANKRLGEYEASGLTPRQVAEMVNEYKPKYKCIHEDKNGFCKLSYDKNFKEYCVQAPCSGAKYKKVKRGIKI